MSTIPSNVKVVSNDPITTTSSTIQGQFLEVALALQKQTYVEITIDPDLINNTISISGTISAEFEGIGEEIRIKGIPNPFNAAGNG